MKIIKNPYLEEIKINLPRILSLFDSDISSETYGLGDRYHWAWGLIDFGNATFQGVVNGMAYLWDGNLWPYKSKKEVFLNRIYAIVCATDTLIRKDGSLEEAFPNEGSYCVTALVAFDLLCSYELLGKYFEPIQKRNWLKIVSKLIYYLKNYDEEHAFISNHLATAIAALTRWNLYTNDHNAKLKAHTLLNKIFKNQSSEGWYLEYDGFDAGYQSICTYYLSDVYKITQNKILKNSLNKSIKFIVNFAHPDGSFGGIYGSRNTRFYSPAGFKFLSSFSSKAEQLAIFMENSISKKKVITLSSIDEPNLIPMFNSYCWSAAIFRKYNSRKIRSLEYNSKSKLLDNKKSFYFKKSGILVDKGSNHLTIISTHKGGVIYHFIDKKLKDLNTGILVKNQKGKFGSTQGYSQNNKVTFKDNKIEIKSKITTVTKKRASPYSFIILRVLSVTLFKFRIIREFVKKILVKLLITRKDDWGIENIREITLGEKIVVKDSFYSQSKYTIIKNPKDFIHIHMASKGYWQIHDETGLSQ
ncbi:hypothetical protein OA957_00305 [Prochlorococcus sp. AH-716-B04]|nr:hypothetical protein [Prochlorococcus sp. AH-716-B04]